ncbi:MAG TPA: YihY family inner membrane protein [Spongiibacteraceae bacterium]|nr:YihY family inner membrane protein [Spongiibacteraceae bacterium]
MTKLTKHTHLLAPIRWRTAVGFARHVWTHFQADQCTRTAAALTYLSLFAVVPLLTVVFAMLSVVPAFSQVGGDVQGFVFSHFLPSSGQEIQAYLLEFSQQARKLTGVGIAILIATVLTMLMRIEKEFNAIWHTRGNRTGFSSFLRYWAILSLGPLFIGLAFGISTYLASLHVLFAQVDIFGIRKFLFIAAPYLLTAAAFSLLFAAVPNCRVPTVHALIGGGVSAFCFEVAKYLFARVMANASYQLIYGTFAAIPLFLLWVYTSWIIVLAGAEFVHALANYGGRDSHLPNWLAALCVLEALWRKHHTGNALRENELLQRRYLLGHFTLSAEHWAQVRDGLFDAGLIVLDSNGDYRLARALQNYTLWQLLEQFTPQPTPPEFANSIETPWLIECAGRLVRLRETNRSQLHISLDELFAHRDTQPVTP